ncbi:MAG: hypothetical protein WC764_00155 [Candidatus Paceibacterota bacterium]
MWRIVRDDSRPIPASPIEFFTEFMRDDPVAGWALVLSAVALAISIAGQFAGVVHP